MHGDALRLELAILVDTEMNASLVQNVKEIIRRDDITGLKSHNLKVWADNAFVYPCRESPSAVEHAPQGCFVVTLELNGPFVEEEVGQRGPVHVEAEYTPTEAIQWQKSSISSIWPERGAEHGVAEKEEIGNEQKETNDQQVGVYP